MLNPVTVEWNEGAPISHPEPHAGSRFGSAVAVDGDSAFITDFGHPFGILARGRAYRYRYSSAAGKFVLQQTFGTPGGVGAFGFDVSVAEGTAAVAQVGIVEGVAGRVHIIEDQGGSWALVQSIDAGASSAPTSSSFAANIELHDNLLAISNGDWVEIWRRPAVGAMYSFDSMFQASASVSSLAMNGGTVAVGLAYGTEDGEVEVWRETACTGGADAWLRVHRLRTAYQHYENVRFGADVDLDGEQLIAGLPGRRFLTGVYSGQRSGGASVFDVSPDCDQNGIEDACEIAGGAADLDGDGVLDDCEAVGRRYCSPAVPTSLGAPAYVLLQGSDEVDRNEIWFTFLGVPSGSVGLMLASQTPGFTANPGGSDGNLCLGGTIGRRLETPHPAWFSGTNGVISQRFDLSSSPTSPMSPMSSGETWYFQGWFRDSGSSNFTDARQLLLR